MGKGTKIFGKKIKILKYGGEEEYQFAGNFIQYIPVLGSTKHNEGENDVF